MYFMKRELSDICSISSGVILRRFEAEGNGTPIKCLSLKSVEQEGINSDYLREIVVDTSKVDNLVTTKPNQIVIKSIQPFLSSLIIDENPLLVPSQLYLIDCDKTVVFPEFLQILLQGKEIQQKLLNCKRGNYISRITKNDLYKIEIDLPSLESQRKILELVSLQKEKIAKLKLLIKKEESVLDYIITNG